MELGKYRIDAGREVLVGACGGLVVGHYMFIPLATEAEADLLRITLLLLLLGGGLDFHVLGHVGGM